MGWRQDRVCRKGDQLGVDGMVRMVFVVSGSLRQYYSGVLDEEVFYRVFIVFINIVFFWG